MDSTYGGVSTLDSHLDSSYSIRNTSSKRNLLATFQRKVGDLIYNPQINYTLVGIVAEENNKCPSGYGVRDHVDGAITLIIVDTETGSKQYITQNLGPKKEEGGQPGINLIEYIKANYPDLEILVTGRRLIADTGKIKNETIEPGTDIEDVIKNYEVELEETETLGDSEAKEYNTGSNENYDPEASDAEQDPDSEPDSEGSKGELVVVAVEGKAEGEASESTD